MRSQWNDREDAALQGLTPEAQVIYLRGFRRYMNYSSGVAGGRIRKLSYKALAELISVEPDWGSRRVRGEAPTRGRVRARIAELERAGLVVDHGSCRALGLIFRLPLADTGFVYPEKEQPKEQPGEKPEEQPKGKVVNHPSFQGVNADQPERNNQESDQGSNQRNDTHQVSPLLSPYSQPDDPDTPWSDDTRPEAPNDWGSFLARERMWAFHHVFKPNLVVMYQSWITNGLTVGDVRMVMAMAEAHLNRVPNGPEYYRSFAESYITARKREQDETKNQNQNRRTTNAGSPESAAGRSQRGDKAGKERQFFDPGYAIKTF